MKLYKLQEGGCDGCPYYQSPPLDFPKEQQYHNCRLNHYESLSIEKINEQCPLQTIEDILENFMKYLRNNNYDISNLVDFQLTSRAIQKFIDEGYL